VLPVSRRLQELAYVSELGMTEIKSRAEMTAGRESSGVYSRYQTVESGSHFVVALIVRSYGNRDIVNTDFEWLME
jgi:hypothetical protein